MAYYISPKKEEKMLVSMRKCREGNPASSCWCFIFDCCIISHFGFSIFVVATSLAGFSPSLKVQNCRMRLQAFPLALIKSICMSPIKTMESFSMSPEKTVRHSMLKPSMSNTIVPPHPVVLIANGFETDFRPYVKKSAFWRYNFAIIVYTII